MKTMTAKEPPLCVNCKHHKFIPPYMHLCMASVETDVVTGEATTPLDCDVMRARTGECMKVGRLFEAKE